MITMQEVRFRYPESDFRLSIDEFAIQDEERVGIIGPSGSGKSTLLHLLAGIQQPDSGCIRFNDHTLTEMDEQERRHFRIFHLGFIFQTFELLEYLTVRENILLPFYVNYKMERTKKTEQTLDEVTGTSGIQHLLDRFPEQLSQGERQRVAICRALVTSPDAVLADEPAGNLDPDRSKQILDLLVEQISERSGTLIIATHDRTLLDSADRILNTEDLMVHS